VQQGSVRDDPSRWPDTRKLAGRPTFKARLATQFNVTVKRG
jgi:hypothetical protein